MALDINLMAGVSAYLYNQDLSDQAVDVSHPQGIAELHLIVRRGKLTHVMIEGRHISTDCYTVHRGEFYTSLVM